MPSARTRSLGRVVDEGRALFPHHAHGRRPADPVVTGDVGDRVGLPADAHDDVAPRPGGERRARRDGPGHLGPRALGAARLLAAPAALLPSELHWPTAGGDVTHPTEGTALRRGGPAAQRAPRLIRLGLHDDRQLAVDLLGRHDQEPLQSENARRRTTTVSHAVASLSWSCWNSRKTPEATALSGG